MLNTLTQIGFIAALVLWSVIIVVFLAVTIRNKLQNFRFNRVADREAKKALSKVQNEFEDK